MSRRSTGHGPTGHGPTGHSSAVRGGLVAAGALAFGIWLGVSVGLATRARRKPAGGSS